MGPVGTDAGGSKIDPPGVCPLEAVHKAMNVAGRLGLTEVEADMIAMAICEIGSLMVWSFSSMTKFAHIMKNMRSWSTTSSKGVRFGSALLPSLPMVWGTLHLRAVKAPS